MFYVKLLVSAFFVAGLVACNDKSSTQPSQAISQEPTSSPQQEAKVVIHTTDGDIKVALDPRPSITTENFLYYVQKGFYTGTQFHRVIQGFMIQAGGFTATMKEKHPDHPSIKNEGPLCDKNTRGTIAMARASDPHSATTQFFINTVNNDFLDFTAETPQGWGYCAFGHVIEGMSVVDKIASSPTMTSGGFQNVPVNTVLITSIERENN